MLQSSAARLFPPHHSLSTLENDDRADAIEILSLPASLAVVTNPATVEPDDPQPSCAFEGAEIGRSVWYAFTAPQDLQLSLSTARSAFDTQLVVRDPDNLSELACSEDISDANLRSALDVDLVADQDVLIQIGPVALASSPVAA